MMLGDLCTGILLGVIGAGEQQPMILIYIENATAQHSLLDGSAFGRWCLRFGGPAQYPTNWIDELRQ
jgi:hypothetical protein